MVELKNFYPIRNHKRLFEPITVYVGEKEILVIEAPSGRGKTSILDCIRGNCEYQGLLNSSKNYFSIYQDSKQFFPWFSIHENLLLTCKDNKKILELSSRWNIKHLLDCKPNQISGGQNQRFIIIRALLSNCNLMLFDEPLSSLDKDTARQIALDSKDIIKKDNKTALWITHSSEEAQLISDIHIRL